ncbi:hypothetical protein [Chryseobacterium sp. T1]
MKLNNKELHDFFLSKDILALYHANTVTTSITFLKEKGLLSRGAVEDLGLVQTYQKSDDADKIVNVWNDVFLDTIDLHTHFKRQNFYGPILFEFDISLILDDSYDIWITKDNPMYWDEDTPNEDRYFIDVDELREGWDKYPRQKKMITIRGVNKPILFEYVRRVLVDDPRIKIPNESGEYFSVVNAATNLIKEVVPDNHILKGKFTFRQCKNCYCRENYLREVSVNEIKKLFL